MSYRLLWGVAVVGLGLQLAGFGWAAISGSNSSLNSPSHLLTISGLAMTVGALFGAALLWVDDCGAGAAGKTRLLFRSAAVPSVALVAAGAIWLAMRAEDAGIQPRPFEGVTIAEAALHSVPQSVASDPPHGGSTAAESASPHSHSGTTAAGVTASASGNASPMGESSAHTHGSDAPVSAVQLAAAAAFVGQVKASTAKYEDIRAAMADGYLQITQDLPAIAAHFVKPAYLVDSVMMDPTKPEFLLYTKRLDGNWRLVGTMFYGGPGGEAAPNYFGALDAWHLHENLCFVSGAVRTTGSQDECKGGLFVKKTNWQLHVWTVADADSVFAHDYSKISPGAFPAATKPAAQELLVRAP